ncbi:MAG: ATP-binding protein [Lachnospiraceae bacterium]|jgi:signal transduction histidine kinase|nr:ATP-binding protein [Lachnospiraceae bacterium]MCH4030565.1 ATP-binding protein [Lachnospiraceae bacterium]MCH4069774.1 ATP-binding protein [Lachnospiraceae bacterium]MCH4107287.1 ATP-binding protein [Lachnospiraceae bacterium]MCI1301858.1 ATP-binding protein [Lachnospiraceae bacterium]
MSFSGFHRHTSDRKKRFISSLSGALLNYKVLLFALIVTAGLVPVAVFSVVQRNIQREESIQNELAQLQIRAVVLSDDITSYSSLADARRAGVFLQYSKYTSLNAMRIRIVDTSMKVVMDTYEQENDKYLVNPRVLKAFSTWSTASTGSDSEKTIETAVPLESSAGERLGVFVISMDVTQIDAQFAGVGSSTGIILAIIVLLVLFAAFLATRWLDRKEKNVNMVLSEIAAGHTSLRLRPSRMRDSAKTAELINEILDNSSLLDKTREEFVSNVSHELKTPMTSIKVLADSLNSAGDVPVEMYKDFMKDITREIDRENKIIEDLLSLARMDRPESTLNVSNVNMNDLIETTLKRLSPLADLHRTEILFESYRTVTAEVDEIKMTQVITNLVENAIKYGTEGGWVRVFLNADYQYFFLRVEDNGIGIPKEMQAHVFERFYRVDKTRSRETGGTGLGLAIVRSIVLMHHGTIRLHSETEAEGGASHGSVFTVRIPLKYSDAALKSSAAKESRESGVTEKETGRKSSREHGK